MFRHRQHQQEGPTELRIAGVYRDRLFALRVLLQQTLTSQSKYGPGRVGHLKRAASVGVSNRVFKADSLRKEGSPPAIPPRYAHFALNELKRARQILRDRFPGANLAGYRPAPQPPRQENQQGEGKHDAGPGGHEWRRRVHRLLMGFLSAQRIEKIEKSVTSARLLCQIIIITNTTRKGSIPISAKEEAGLFRLNEKGISGRGVLSWARSPLHVGWY